MGVKKKPTLKILFRQFAISLIVMLVAAIIVPSGLEGLAVNAGLATRANLSELQVKEIIPTLTIATVYKGNIIKNLIMDCQSYTKYRPNETTGGIFVSWRRKEELPTGA